FFAQIVSTSEAFACCARRPFVSIAVTTARPSASGSSSPTTTSSPGPISIVCRTDRSIQLRIRGTSRGFGSRFVTLRTAPHAEHFTTPSKTISSFPPTFPRRTRWGPSTPHDSHFRTRALGAGTGTRTRPRQNRLPSRDPELPPALGPKCAPPVPQRLPAFRARRLGRELLQPCILGLGKSLLHEHPVHLVELAAHGEWLQDREVPDSLPLPALLAGDPHHRGRHRESEREAGEVGLHGDSREQVPEVDRPQHE